MTEIQNGGDLTQAEQGRHFIFQGVLEYGNVNLYM